MVVPSLPIDWLHVLCLGAALVSVARAPGQESDARPKALPISGAPVPGLASLDQCMGEFMTARGIPGGVLAVSYRGRLVYERGFGYADVAAKQQVRSDALFRIASLSKPFTAVAVLQLVERGKLDLEDRVFDLLPLRPFGDRKMDPRWRKITIRHLLQHRGGWNRDECFDPMFRNHLVAAEAGHDGPATAADTIRYMVGRPLQFEPGATYAYSNFGYCLLGRVIEKVAVCSYEAFLRRSVLAPLGIEGMVLGATLLAERRPGEVRYYGQAWRKARSVFAPEKGLSVPWEYGGFYLEAMDSHGAWLANGRELLRFAAELRDPKHCALLKPESVAQLFARPPGIAGHSSDGTPREEFYACGWLVTAAGQDHGGSLPGTTAKLMLRRDGIHWAVLFNTRRDAKGERISPDDIEPELQKRLAAVRDWPEADLFESAKQK